MFLDEDIRHDLAAFGVAVGLGHAQIGQLQAPVLEYAVQAQEAPRLVHAAVDAESMGAAGHEVNPVLAVGVVVGAIGSVDVVGVVGIIGVVVREILDVGPPGVGGRAAVGCRRGG